MVAQAVEVLRLLFAAVGVVAAVLDLVPAGFLLPLLDQPKLSLLERVELAERRGRPMTPAEPMAAMEVCRHLAALSLQCLEGLV